MRACAVNGAMRRLSSCSRSTSKKKKKISKENTPMSGKDISDQPNWSFLDTPSTPPPEFLQGQSAELLLGKNERDDFAHFSPTDSEVSRAAAEAYCAGASSSPEFSKRSSSLPDFLKTDDAERSETAAAKPSGRNDVGMRQRWEGGEVMVGRKYGGDDVGGMQGRRRWTGTRDDGMLRDDGTPWDDGKSQGDGLEMRHNAYDGKQSAASNGVDAGMQRHWDGGRSAGRIGLMRDGDGCNERVARNGTRNDARDGKLSAAWNGLDMRNRSYDERQSAGRNSVDERHPFVHGGANEQSSSSDEFSKSREVSLTYFGKPAMSSLTRLARPSLNGFVMSSDDCLEASPCSGGKQSKEDFVKNRSDNIVIRSDSSDRADAVAVHVRNDSDVPVTLVIACDECPALLIFPSTLRIPIASSVFFELLYSGEGESPRTFARETLYRVTITDVHQRKSAVFNVALEFWNASSRAVISRTVAPSFLRCNMGSLNFGELVNPDCGSSMEFILKNVHPHFTALLFLQVKRETDKDSFHVRFRHLNDRSLTPGGEARIVVDLLPNPNDPVPTTYSCAVTVTAKFIANASYSDDESLILKRGTSSSSSDSATKATKKYVLVARGVTRFPTRSPSIELLPQNAASTKRMVVNSEKR